MLDWFQLSLHDPTLFTLFLFSAVFHHRVYRFQKSKSSGGTLRPQDDPVLVFCELESIKRVQEAIQDPSHARSDALILSVGSLVNNRVNHELMWDETSPFQPPLRSLQWLNIYGTLTPDPIHLRGLVKLIKLRDGLERTGLPGLASILS
jgi:hypothetical protein